MHHLLYDEHPVFVQPSLVRRLGILEAAIVQQLHFWSARATCEHDGQRYVYKTYQDWSDEIGVSAKAARGACDRLRKAGVIVGIQNPNDARDRTLWWRIDYAVLDTGAPSAPAGSSTPTGGGPASAPAGTSNARASKAQNQTQNPSTEIARDEFPDDLPEAMHERAIEVGKILKRTALARGQRREVTRATVGHALVTYPDRDHVVVARDLEFWLMHGKGARQSCADIVSRYRNFLATSEPMAGPPLAGAAAGNGHRRGVQPSAEDFARIARGEA